MVFDAAPKLYLQLRLEQSEKECGTKIDRDFKKIFHAQLPSNRSNCHKAPWAIKYIPPNV